MVFDKELDENLKAIYEHVDLCLAVRAAGGSIILEPQAVVTYVVGQPLYGNYLGQPPNDITGDVRFKFLPHLQVEVARTYYFHFGSTNWSPSFVVLVTPI